MPTKLSDAQVLGLRYYARLGLPKEERRAAPRIKVPSTRVEASLLEKGLVEVWKYEFGPHYRLTDAGKAAFQSISQKEGEKDADQH